MEKSFYDVLYLPKSASYEEIRQQFYKLAHSFHPDRPNGDIHKFTQIKEAYLVLKDKHKRNFYDMFGNEGYVLFNAEEKLYAASHILTKGFVGSSSLFIIGLILTVYILPIFTKEYNGIRNSHFFFLFLITFIPYLIGFILVTYSIIRYFRNKPEYYGFLLILFEILLKSFAFMIQILILTLILDKNIKEYNRLLILTPYFFFEIFNIFFRIFSKYTKKKKIKKKKLTKMILYSLVFRLSLVLLFFIKLDVRLKFGIALLGIFLIICANVWNELLVIDGTVYLLIVCYVFGCMRFENNILFYLSLASYCISTLPIIPYLCFYGAFWMIIIPQSLFKTQKMLCFQSFQML